MVETPIESGEITASAYLVVASAGAWCDIHPLVPGNSIVIGRGDDNQIVMQSNRCSRRHCELFSQDGEWFVRDLKSRNGTLLNGKLMRKVKRLKPGDRLEIAGTVFLLTSSLSDIEGASLDASIHDADTTTAAANAQRPKEEHAAPENSHDGRQTEAST